MVENALTRDQLNMIREFLQRTVEPYLIILFGSAARNRLRPDSDIDLAFLSDLEFSDYDNMIHAGELADLIGRNVDLIDLNKASTVFKAQIIGKGKVIYSRDELRRKIFAMESLKEYAILNEERQCVLDKFKERRLNHADG